MKKKPEEKIDEDWMSTYGDMVTLLLCFFVMMLSVSKPDVAKYEQISAGLSEGLGKKIIQRPIEMLMTELNDDIQSLDLEKKVAIGSDTQGIVLEFGGDMLFNRGSADIKPEALPAPYPAACGRWSPTRPAPRQSRFGSYPHSNTAKQPP